jgi:major outer membrane protein IB
LRGQIGYLRVGGKTRLTAAERGKIEQSGASLGMVHKF